jgi:hypothetical protein
MLWLMTSIAVASTSVCPQTHTCIKKTTRDKCGKCFLKDKAWKTRVKTLVRSEQEACAKRLKRKNGQIKTEKLFCLQQVGLMRGAAKKEARSAYQKGFLHGSITVGTVAVVVAGVVVTVILMNQNK